MPPQSHVRSRSPGRQPGNRPKPITKYADWQTMGLAYQPMTHSSIPGTSKVKGTPGYEYDAYLNSKNWRNKLSVKNMSQELVQVGLIDPATRTALLDADGKPKSAFVFYRSGALSSETGKTTSGMSNWAPIATQDVTGHWHDTSEGALFANKWQMLAQRNVRLSDGTHASDILRRIQQARANPATKQVQAEIQKEINRKASKLLSHQDQQLWRGITKTQVLIATLKQKLKNCPKLLETLILTGNSTLLEGTDDSDPIYGAAVSPETPQGTEMIRDGSWKDRQISHNGRTIKPYNELGNAYETIRNEYLRSSDPQTQALVKDILSRERANFRPERI